jgi:hypothetical protein
MVLPLLGHARCVFPAQDYESFHHAAEPTYESFLAESETFKALYSLPVPIIATSQPISGLIETRTGKRPYLMPVAINKAFFKLKSPRNDERKRILFVGNYLMPYKGMRSGLDAIEILQRQMNVELVLITQEDRGRKLFDQYSFPKEIHFCPTESEVPEIIASCDLYCCTSWYEGFGLPALEAFCSGVPVVSTRTIGVNDYGIDGFNLLLANPDDASDLSEKIFRVLTDAKLAEQLVSGGTETMEGRYEWTQTRDAFLAAIQDIDATYEGAGEIDTARMQALLGDLEREGSLTPIETYREFQRLDDRIARVSANMKNSSASPDQIRELEVIRDGLAPFTANPRTRYYSAFKAKYDLCLLLLELAGTPDGIHIARLLHPTTGAPAATNAAPLTEFRYTQS